MLSQLRGKEQEFAARDDLNCIAHEASSDLAALLDKSENFPETFVFQSSSQKRGQECPRHTGIFR